MKKIFLFSVLVLFAAAGGIYRYKATREKLHQAELAAIGRVYQ